MLRKTSVWRPNTWSIDAMKWSYPASLPPSLLPSLPSFLFRLQSLCIPQLASSSPSSCPASGELRLQVYATVNGTSMYFSMCM